MGLLEDRLAAAMAKEEKGSGKDEPAARRGSLGSIMKSKIRVQHQNVSDEDDKPAWDPKHQS